MIRLDRITMQGFKSFAGKISIPFPSNFSCLCGPNGSGKSNIVDALIFVLGTSSAKSMRASKLQSLIFNGGKDKKPADYCLVSLYINNKDRKIPGFDDDIKITRKITRSGISIYKLNGKTVTRSKILDIISNANLSPYGFNIIKQGDVTRIIEMSDKERREIIDEISGISEFDEKKTKASGELEIVDTKVREMMIIVTEKEKYIERLKTERENAVKYEKFSKQLRKAKASLSNIELKKSEKAREELDGDINEKVAKFNEAEEDYKNVENKIEKDIKKINEINETIIQKSRDYQVSKKISEMNTQLVMKKDKIESSEKEAQRLKILISELETAGQKKAVKEILRLGKEGVYGTVLSLINIPEKYSIAIDVALGRHKNDIITDNDEIASECIRYLKKNKIGRARFLPLNKIRSRKIKDIKEKGIVDIAINLVEYDNKFKSAIEYVLGSTLIIDKIETTMEKSLNNIRCATLDGDLKEASGVMIGGFYTKAKKITNIDNYRKQFTDINDGNKKIEKEIIGLKKEIEKFENMEKEESEEVDKLQERRKNLEEAIERDKIKLKTLNEKRSILQSKVNEMKIKKAKLDAKFEDLRLESDEFKDIKKYYDDLSIDELKEKIKECVIGINEIGPVNMKAIEEYETLSVEFIELRKKLNRLLDEKNAIEKTVSEIEKKRFEKFMETLDEIAKNFEKIYRDLTGGTTKLGLEEENIIESGLIIEASPSGKKIINIDSMSGGEKTLASLAFLFAIMQHYAAPFYVLDEIDAALDKPNTKKVDELIKMYSENIQFIVITHNDTTIASADKVFGVSMEEGISKVFGIEMPKD